MVCSKSRIAVEEITHNRAAGLQRSVAHCKSRIQTSPKVKMYKAVFVNKYRSILTSSMKCSQGHGR